MRLRLHSRHLSLNSSSRLRIQFSSSCSFSTSSCTPSQSSNRNHQDESSQENRHRSQYNYDPFSLTPSPNHLQHPLLTWNQLRLLKNRPSNCRILARDFIHDSLYNPNYGYFSKSAVLLPDAKGKGKGKGKGKESVRMIRDGQVDKDTETENGRLDSNHQPFQFNQIRSENQFMKAVERKYLDFESQFNKSKSSSSSTSSNPTSISSHSSPPTPPTASTKRQKGKPSSTKIWSAQGLEEAQERGRRQVRRSQSRQEEGEEEVSFGNSPMTMSMGMGIGARIDDNVDEDDIKTMAARQVWHTPTELFKPWYARSIARYLVQEYKHNLYPYDDLLIYELGAGSGSLASGILTYLRDEEPLVYERTRYRIVEISERLGQIQKEKLEEFGVKFVSGSSSQTKEKQVASESEAGKSRMERDKVEIINKDFLEWDKDVVEPCFVVALEVLDNLAHDVVRYSTTDFRPYQNIISIDSSGDMEELYEPISDPTIIKYLNLINTNIDPNRSNTSPTFPTPPTSTFLQKFLPQPIRTSLAENFPFYPNLTPPHFIPTNQLRLFQILKTHFPLHRLIFSDFNSLPNTIDESISSSSSGIFAPSFLGFNRNKGKNSPVVQTRIKGEMVPVTKFTVQQGYFDIFFPTDFEEMKEVYQKVMREEDDHQHHHQQEQEKVKSQFDSEKLRTQEDTIRKSRSEPRSSPLETSNSIRSDYFFKSSSPSSRIKPENQNNFFSPTLNLSGAGSNQQRKIKNLRILNHGEFLMKYGEVEKTKLRDGSNPMVSWYQNAKWFLT